MSSLKKYKMVSLDTSSTETGYAYFENGILIESGVINLKKEKDIEIRLEDMCLNIINVLSEYKPETVVIEMTVVERGASTQRLLSEIVGVVRGWALCNYAEFVIFRPSVWRKYVCAEDEKVPKKRADCKLWSMHKVKQLFSIEVDDNESDAILVGQARINMMKSIQQKSQKQKDIA